MAVGRELIVVIMNTQKGFDFVFICGNCSNDLLFYRQMMQKRRTRRKNNIHFQSRTEMSKNKRLLLLKVLCIITLILIFSFLNPLSPIMLMSEIFEYLLVSSQFLYKFAVSEENLNAVVL